MNLSTKMYKVQLREYSIYARYMRPISIDENKILPHSWEETITQISNFTSQRYEVLWDLAKSDKILLTKEVSFNSPNIHTLSVHGS